MSEQALAAYRTVLSAFGEAGQRAVPHTGGELKRKLAEIQEDLTSPVAPDAMGRTSEQVRAELSQWADRALKQNTDNEREIKEIIGVVARAAESIGKRDDKYSKEIGSLNQKMKAIADLKDLTVMRRSIIESTTALQSCVEKMVEESKASVKALTAEVAEYRTQLVESERAATVDPLTDLANRRAFERHLEARIASGLTFTLIMIDLNGFKAVNDTYGHLAGDDLLCQFAAELRSQFTPADFVGRWGGDEFVAVVAGSIEEGNERAVRIRRWALGEYKIGAGNHTAKTVLGASLAVVEWDGRETGVELLARADQGMYRDKDSARSKPVFSLPASTPGSGAFRGQPA